MLTRIKPRENLPRQREKDLTNTEPTKKMTATNFTIAPGTAAAICMSVEDAIADPRRASILAGRYLRAIGYERKYNHSAWDRGMRWFAPDGMVYNASNTDVLTYALAK